MKELLRTNDPVLLSYVEALLGEAEIGHAVLDTNMSVVEGSILEGRCQMTGASQGSSSSRRSVLTADELAKYLEVDTSMIGQWANAGKLPGIRENNSWKFDRKQVDEWVANGKVK